MKLFLALLLAVFATVALAQEGDDGHRWYYYNDAGCHGETVLTVEAETGVCHEFVEGESGRLMAQLFELEKYLPDKPGRRTSWWLDPSSCDGKEDEESWVYWHEDQCWNFKPGSTFDGEPVLSFNAY